MLESIQLELKQEKQAKLEVEATVGQLELELKKLKADLHVREERSILDFGFSDQLYEHLSCMFLQDYLAFLLFIKADQKMQSLVISFTVL